VTFLWAFEAAAKISDCGRYRYTLTRTVGSGARSICWVMLNPSTADGTQDDATIRKITAYSSRWNFGRMVVVNLFAWRERDPKLLPTDVDVAAGPENDEYIRQSIDSCEATIFAWGNSLAAVVRNPRETRVLELARGHDVRVLARTKDGAPRHPLYLPGSLDFESLELVSVGAHS
jgi:hypothetical protein